MNQLLWSELDKINELHHYSSFSCIVFAHPVSFCSGGGYKVVCKTDYSYVLRQFNCTATLFQENLHEAARCLNNSNENLGNCFYASNIWRHIRTIRTEIRIVPRIRAPPFSIKDVNEMQTACNIFGIILPLKTTVSSKDLPLNEYNSLPAWKTLKHFRDSSKLNQS